MANNYTKIVDGTTSLKKLDADYNIEERIVIEEWNLRKLLSIKILNTLLVVNGIFLFSMISMYVWENYAILHNLLKPADRVVNTNVVLGIIGGITVQFGAVSLAVTNWLFPKKR